MRRTSLSGRSRWRRGCAGRRGRRARGSTIFSPCEAGRVETRRSTTAPLTATRARPSCGPQPVGDVEPGEDLDARHERRRDGARKRAHLAQHAVHAMTHRDPLLLRLEVDVARAAPDAVGEELVHEADRPTRQRPAPQSPAVSAPNARCSTSTGGDSGSRRLPVPRVADTSARSARRSPPRRPTTHRTGCPVAKLTARSASRSSGSLVATSRAPSPSSGHRKDAVAARPPLGEERDRARIDAGEVGGRGGGGAWGDTRSR